jgi:methanogen extracellular protein (TIGR04279 family)
MELQGRNMLLTPSAGYENGSWTYPFGEYPAYQENETISGTFWGNRSLAGINASPCITAFGASDLLSSLDILNRSINLTCDGLQIRLNGTGDAALQMRGLPMGLYTLYLLDSLNRTVLTAAPILITRGELEVDLPENLSAGQILPVKLNASGSAGSYTLAALMLPLDSYSSAALWLNGWGTRANLTARLTISNQSLELTGEPEGSEQLLNQILSILPEESSAAVQESERPRAELYLLTDPDWHRGEYMLLCAICASGQGIVAIEQSELEVV